MIIIQNALKCRHCGEVVESTHRHDFVVHFCDVKPRTARRWVGTGIDAVLVEVPGEVGYNFAVDGGQAYFRWIGNPADFEDVSKYWPGFDGSHLYSAAIFQRHCIIMRNTPEGVVSIERVP